MMTKKIILTCIIVVGIVLVALVLNFYYGLRKMYRYEFFYNKNALVFEGAPVNKQMEYDKVIVNLNIDTLEKIPRVQICGQKYRLNDLSSEDLKQIGVECDKYGNVCICRARPPDGFSPPYFLSFHYVDDDIEAFSYSIQNPPDPSMGPPQKVPVTLLFQDGIQITLPVKQSEIETKFGKPDSIRRYIRFP